MTSLARIHHDPWDDFSDDGPEEIVPWFKKTLALPATDIQNLIDKHYQMLAKGKVVCDTFHALDGEDVYHFFRDTSDIAFSMSFFDYQRFEKNVIRHSWNTVLRETGIWDILPGDRKKFWTKVLEKGVIYEDDSYNAKALGPLVFNEEIVRATLEDLSANRLQYLSERVNGIFRALSPHHATNKSHGFTNRFILNHFVTEYGSSSTQDYVDDFRIVILRIIGAQTSDVLCYNLRSRAWAKDLQTNATGQWVTMDGGAWRCRVYLKGTIHIEIHPEMAKRLNQILAVSNPNILFTDDRTKTPKPSKNFAVTRRPIPVPVRNFLADVLQSLGQRYPTVTTYNLDRRLIKETTEILEIAGIVLEKENGVSYASITYGPESESVLRHIVHSGMIPDYRTHQYYPTPETIAYYVHEQAGIEPHHVFLEPSAGTGNLVPNAGKGTLVEISDVFATVIRSKFPQHEVVQEDFLTYQPSPVFDRIIMNPPFADGRAKAHYEHAKTLLAPNGRLVAVLPLSCDTGNLPHKVFHNAFSYTSISVKVVTYDKHP